MTTTQHPALPRAQLESMRSLLTECHDYLKPVHDQFMRAEKHEEEIHRVGSDLFKRISCALGGQVEPECSCPSGDGSLRYPCPAHGRPAQDERETGMYAVRYLSHWDGEGDEVYVLAWKHEGEMVTHEGGVKISDLLEYQGDKVLNVWPLDTTRPPQTERHQDNAAVDRFADAMKAKLAASRAKGRGGWDDPNVCTVEFLAKLLVEHLGKGNAGTFEDVANFAMMLHQRGADPKVLADTLSVRPAQTEQQSVAVVPEEWKAGFKLHEIHKALDCGLPAPSYWAETCDGEPHVHTKLWSGLPGCGSFHSSRFWPLYGVSMLAFPIAQTAPSVCMGCVDLSSHVRELQHKMDYYKAQTAPQPEQSGLVEMIDAAMIEMRNIDPPLRRSDCERLIRAALSAVTAEIDVLRKQIKILQSAENSWQSGYDKGRHDGTRHRQSEVDQLRAGVDRLRAFANEIVSGAFEGGSIDGGDIQNMGVKHGLLRIEQRENECDEVCACREYGFPTECYRKTELLRAVMTAKETL